MRIAKILFWVMLSFFVDELKAQERLTVKDLTVLEKPSKEMMQDYLTRLVDEQFSARDSILSTLRTDADWDKRAKAIRDSVASWTGPFPERSPLNARVTGRIERKDYVIEKILFESQPVNRVVKAIYRSLKKGEAWWLITADEHERERVIKEVLTGE